MKCFVAVLGLLALTGANAGLFDYNYATPGGGTTFFNTGPGQPLTHAVAAAPAVPVAAPVHYAAPAVAANSAYAATQPQYNNYHFQPQYNYQGQYAVPAVQYAAAAPALAVTQKVGYAHHQVPVNVPVTKLAVTQGVTQKLVDVAQPAVTNRRIKVRRPALRKEFYDIEHRVIVRPAGSATLELSQPISKEQNGPAVLTPTNYQQIAPVVRYGASREIIDGQGVSQLAQIRANLARGIEQAPQQQQQQQQQQQAPEFRAAPQPQQAPAPQPQQAPELRAAPQQQAPEFRAAPQPQLSPEFRAAPQPQLSQAPRLRPLQLRPQPQPQQQQPQPQQQQQQPQLRSADAEIIEAGSGPAPQQQQPQQQQPQQPQQFNPAQGARLSIPEMPVEIQARLLELLSARGGTVTEVLGENGKPNSASVLQVADQLQDVNLQGGERITTRRIVVTRPIETIQEVDIQEPATKYHRHAVNVPTLFKTPVTVNVPAVKNVATPVLQTTYAHPQYSAAPAYAY